MAPRRSQANLYGDNGQLIGTHFGGPTWLARDGSLVKAQRVDGVIVLRPQARRPPGQRGRRAAIDEVAHQVPCGGQPHERRVLRSSQLVAREARPAAPTRLASPDSYTDALTFGGLCRAGK